MISKNSINNILPIKIITKLVYCLLRCIPSPIVSSKACLQCAVEILYQEVYAF